MAPKNKNVSRGSSVAAMKRRVASLHTELNGKVFNPQADPKGFVSSPWNQLTVALKYLGSEEGITRAVLTAEDLGADIWHQLGAPGTTNLQFKVDSYRAWANSDTTYMTDFNMDIYDVVNTNATDDNNRIIQTISDLSGKLTFAKVGYVLPKTQRNTVLSQTSTQYLLGMDLPPMTTVELYVRLMWRFRPPQIPPEAFITKHAVLRPATKAVKVSEDTPKPQPTPVVVLADPDVEEVSLQDQMDKVSESLQELGFDMKPEAKPGVEIERPGKPTPRWDIEGPIEEWTYDQWMYFVRAENLKAWNNATAQRHDDWIMAASGKCGAYYYHKYGLVGPTDKSGISKLQLAFNTLAIFWLP